LSYSIEFINWDESNDGTAVHTITDDLELKLDPESITGIDYYKQESRMATISFLNDNSTFIETNLITNMQSYEFNINKNFWEYAIRIKDGTNLMFTGWVKLSSFKYDKKTDTIKIMAMDMLSVILDANDYSYPFQGNPNTGDFAVFLRQFLYYGTSLEHEGVNEYGISYTNNFDYQTDIQQTGMEIDIDGIGDEYYNPDGNWDDYFGNFWGMPSTWENPDYISRDNPYNIQNFRINDDGIVVMTLMRAYRHYGTGTSWGPSGFNIRESYRWRTYFFDENHQPYGFFENSFTTVTYFTEEEDADDYWATPAISIIYSDSYTPNVPSNPTETVLNLVISDTERYYFHSYAWNPITVKYDGMMNFLSLDIKEGDYNVNGIVKMCLMINNLAIKLDNAGNIEIINKDYTVENIEIDDEDVLEYKQSAILKSDVDYESILAPMVETNAEIITNALSDFYNDNIPQYEYNLEIENNYDLNLLNKIVVSGREMQIVEIKKDLHDFYYTIKAWSIDE